VVGEMIHLNEEAEVVLVRYVVVVVVVVVADLAYTVVDVTALRCIVAADSRFESQV
jgi:hypothetical protein